MTRAATCEYGIVGLGSSNRYVNALLQLDSVLVPFLHPVLPVQFTSAPPGRGSPQCQCQWHSSGGN